MSTDIAAGPSTNVEWVRRLPTDPRDIVPSAVVWTLAADFDDAVSPDLLAPTLAREAGVGDRVWQKRTAWLREHGWLEHGAKGAKDGWRLRIAETD